MQKINIARVSSLGSNLWRPECVLAMAGGIICTSDWRGGVNILWPDGNQRLVKARNLDFELKPNGIGLLSDGSFLIAHLGDDHGGLYRLLPDGECEAVLTELDGQPLPPCNYPHVDRHGRVWLTVSTRQIPRANAYRPDVSDGFIVLIDHSGARIVADNLGYTNECSVHPDGKRLFVNETFARKLTSFDIQPDGELTNKQTIAEFGHGSYPDGLVFDDKGGVWITSIISNRVIYCAPDQPPDILLQDVDIDHLEKIEQAFLSGGLSREHLDNVSSEKLMNISSMAFGGHDMCTAYLGCLLDNSIYSFRTRIRGYRPPYWHHTILIPAQKA